MREGAYTLNARTVRERTSTLPNHTAMLTGRRVDEKHGGHGYSDNFDDGGTVHGAAGHYVASVFDVVHDHGGSTALFAAKTKFMLYRRSWNTHGAPDQVGRNDGRAKIDRFTIDHNNNQLVSKLNDELRRKPESSRSCTSRCLTGSDTLMASWVSSTSTRSGVPMCSSGAS